MTGKANVESRGLMLHPFVFAAFPVLSLYSVNIYEAPLRDVLQAAVAVLAGVVLLLLLARLFFRDAGKAAVFASFFVILFFAYGHVFGVVKELALTALGDRLRVRNLYLLVPTFAALLVLALGLVRTRRRLHALHLALTAASLVTVSQPLAGIAGHVLTAGGGKRAALVRDLPLPAPEEIDAATRNSPPDIYYVVFDRYGNTRALRELFGYDNSALDEFLIHRGFYVARDSYANYAGTMLSLASSLNMQHLDSLPEALGPDSREMTPVYELLQSHQVFRILRTFGYRYFHFGSWWPGTRVNRNADVQHNFAAVTTTQFADLLLSTTAVNPFLLKHFIPSAHSLKTFAKLAEIVPEKGPKFVFAHLILPHQPFVFDADGRLLGDAEARRRTDRENYLAQLAFTNRKIEELVTRILDSSSSPPVIVLQSDEGPAELNGLGLSREDTIVAHALILNALHLPGFDADRLYPTITPVNTFRMIFNHYLGTSFPELEDRAYISLGQYPYRFEEITDLLATRRGSPPAPRR